MSAVDRDTDAPNSPRGLTSAEARRRLAHYGPNAVTEARTTPIWRILLRQFQSPLVLLLVFAAVAAAAIGEHTDALAIALVVVLNGGLGFVQEWRAETALFALRRMISAKARVIRDGLPAEIDTRDLVPADLVMLSAGDRVPADLALVEALDLSVDESILTGESLPVQKSLSGPEDAGRALMGTAIVRGRGSGEVTATGARTAFGEIAHLTGSVGERETNLTRQLGRVARQLGIAAILVAAIVALTGILRGQDPVEMAMTGMSIAVAMVPEGLPAVVTISLALGAAAMARKKALARRLQAMEALGAASVICTDKTGTLTENKMTAVEIWIAGETFSVTGTGYDPAGQILRQDAPIRYGESPALDTALRVALGCTHAALRRDGDVWRMIGDPTEGALVTLAYKGWAPLPEEAPLREVPFSSERKRMSMVRAHGDGLEQLAKGAVEQILLICTHWHAPEGPKPLTEETRGEILGAAEAMGARGLRVIALAAAGVARADAAESDLAFVSLVGLIDPPRPEVKDAIGACREAGIRVIMVTGDAPVTARAIASQLDLPSDRAVTGVDLDAMSPEALKETLKEPVLFARTAPPHKMQLVEALQSDQLIVAMTGDGVNDAPALKRADIGVAMGIRGTDVAKDAADLVLLDDNFATIVDAIREGRRQFANLRRFVQYLLASNAGEVLAILVNVALGGPLIFLPTQILWMNLVTDGVTALALGLESGTPDQMEEPPRRLDTGILDWKALALILSFGTYTAGASLYLFYAVLPEGDALARTVAFTGMVVFEKASVFGFRSFTRPCWKLGWFSNRMLILAIVAMIGAQALAVYWPPLQALLRTEAIGAQHWLWIFALAVPLVAVPEAIKTFRHLRRPAAATA